MDTGNKPSLTENALHLAGTLGGRDRLNCIAELNPRAPEEAREQEQRAEEKLSLRGVPVLVKDSIDVRGLHTTAGSLALEDNLAAEDAPVIRNLRRNGAVILGKTNMTEFANFVAPGMPGGYSSRGGQVIHAVDPALSPSGSSSGSGVAVCAGIVPMAVGTDTSFSIIACAKANGVCGLKPPVGALSARGIVPISGTLDSPGPMARNFADTLRLYSAMREEPLPELTATPLNTLRIGINLANSHILSREEQLFFHRLMDRMSAGGVTLGELTQMPALELSAIMQWEFRPALEAYLQGSSASRRTLGEIVAYYEAHPDTMLRYGDAYLRAALEETPGGLRGGPYLAAMETRRRAVDRVTEELRAYDAVLMTGPTNIMHFCGLPSVTVAGGWKNPNGVREAVILYGMEEYRLYRAALAMEQLMEEQV